MTKKKLTKLICAAVASASLIFGGCSQSAETETETVPVEENKSAATAEVTEDVVPVAAGNTASAAKARSGVRNTPVVQVAREVGPAIVGITNKAVAQDFFTNRQVEVERGFGSGVIFRNDGYIVTNNHVIAGANELIVSLEDGSSYSGTLVGTDEMTDIAVVKIDAKNLPSARFGNSDEIMVGEPVVAIGNPMGLALHGSVTVGVISAIDRSISLNDVSLLQTDAAISPGNSGGALVNYEGEVIGINNAKVAREGVEGIAFSIPINTVKDVVNELMEKGYVARPYLGVTIFDPPTAARYGYQLNIKRGVYVFQVAINSPADRAGFQRGDIILSVDGKEVNTVAEVRSNIVAHKVGATIKVAFDRNGTEQTVDVILQEMPHDEYESQRRAG
ncbi:MAG: trypsin-like peptidase domain-containing protein [Selenomonadaceae bacterium]|nr:trypsin-like peptidase domain-containing protein [Selenomonadaceae bacterium]